MTRLGAIVVAVALSCGGGGGPRRTSTLPVYLEVRDVGDAPLRLRDLRGAPVVLHLFTVGSMAAQMDVLQLNAIHDAGRATVIGIALDPADAAQLVRAWPEAAGARYRVAFGSPDLITGKTDLGRVAVVPTTVVLDAHGAVLYRVERQLQRGELERVLPR